MFYLVRTPFWIKKLFNTRIWEIRQSRKVIYLTFDDGPDPVITPFVLDELDKYNAKATFFCIGKNVATQPKIYQRILNEGHAVGNHTYDHLNGWKTNQRVYLENIMKAKEMIHSNLFRPPYGRISNQQSKSLQLPPYGLHTVMWSVLSGDFDEEISSEKCYQRVITKTNSGDIIVFHDSKKAASHLQSCLPRVLKYFSAQGFSFEKIIVK